MTQDEGPAAPRILRGDATREYFTDELCFIHELSNRPGDAAVSIAQARVEPGVCTRWHRLHGIAERYVLLAGRGHVEVGDALGGALGEDVGPGDVVYIPPGCRQRIRCLGDAPLVFLAVCTPRFEQAAYEDIEPLPG